MRQSNMTSWWRCGALTFVADVIDEYGSFDSEHLQIEWSVGSVCGFGSTGRPIGSEGLVDPPSWWNVGGADHDEILNFFGPVCDWNAADGSLNDIDINGILELRIQRNIYGYGGWVDCATNSCFVMLGWSWLHPEPGGGMVGSEGESIRVAVDVPSSWSSQRPNISIDEPGPYRSGQSELLRWKFADVENGTASVQWAIEGTADSCGLQRCYFALVSASEGLAPPAIALAPIVDG